MIKKILITLVLLFFGVSAPSLSASDTGNFFERVRFTETTDTLAVKLLFLKSGNVRHEIRFFEKFIQLELAPAFIRENVKKSFEADSEILDNIQVYAFKPGVIRVRLYLKVNGKMFADNFSVRSKGRELVIYLKKAAQAMEKGLEKKIVKELDREILTALSDLSGEKSGVSSSTPSRPPATVADAGRQRPPESDLVQDMDRGEPVKNTVAGVGKPVVSLSETNEKPVMVSGEPVVPSKQYAAETTQGRQSGAEKRLKRRIDYEIGNLMPEFFKMAGALIVVLSLIFLATAGAKKFLSRNSGFLGGSRLIRVISSTPIGVKKQITIVDVAGEVLVLGVSSDNISMLMKLAPEDAAVLLSGLKDSGRSRATPGARRVFGKKKREARGFNSEVENALKNQKLANRDELINNVAKSIREKIEVLKKA